MEGNQTVKGGVQAELESEFQCQNKKRKKQGNSAVKCSIKKLLKAKDFTNDSLVTWDTMVPSVLDCVT